MYSCQGRLAQVPASHAGQRRTRSDAETLGSTNGSVQVKGAARWPGYIQAARGGEAGLLGPMTYAQPPRLPGMGMVRQGIGARGSRRYRWSCQTGVVSAWSRRRRRSWLNWVAAGCGRASLRNDAAVQTLDTEADGVEHAAVGVAIPGPAVDRLVRLSSLAGR